MSDGRPIFNGKHEQMLLAMSADIGRCSASIDGLATRFDDLTSDVRELRADVNRQTSGLHDEVRELRADVGRQVTLQREAWQSQGKLIGELEARCQRRQGQYETLAHRAGRHSDELRRVRGDITGEVQALDDRLAPVERLRWKAIGAWAAIVAIAGLLGAAGGWVAKAQKAAETAAQHRVADGGAK